MRTKSICRRSRIALVAVAALALAAAFGLRSPASAQDPAGRTLKLTELDKGSTFRHIRNTKTRSSRSNAGGDLIIFTNPLADASGKVIGKLHVQCVTTTGARNFLKSMLTCGGVMVLADGTLTLQAIVSPGVATTTGAVTGGTGAYASARGTFLSAERRGGSDTTITLIGQS